MKRLYLFLILIISSIAAHSQFSYAYIDSIEVIRNSSSLSNPWVGGFNSPQFSEIKLNNDSFPDLFVFDKAGNTIKTFLNDGIAGTPSYTYAPIYEQYFPQDLESFGILADFNNDGKKDIFSYVPGSIKVYKNVTEYNIPQFEPYYTHVLPATVLGIPSNGNVYCYEHDIPGLYDVDQDGDLDVLSFHLGGLNIDYFENTTPAGQDTFILEQRTTCWGHFYEHPQNSSIVLSGCKRNNGNASRHTGSTISLMHLDDNGLLDILLGDVESHHINAIYNNGSNTAANMTSVEYNFPADDTPIDLQEFLGTFPIDIDNDGDKDLLIAPNDPIESIDTTNIQFYQNVGSDNNVDLDLAQTNFLTNGIIDHGTASHPTFTDIDGDGLQDIIVGHTGYFDFYDTITYAPKYITQLAFYNNIGTVDKPKYELITEDFANVSSFNLDGAYPTFGDIDGDGDQDMLLGNHQGWIVHFENTSGPSLSPNYQLADDKFFLLKSIASASPNLFDINNDSLLDLVVGEKDGYMKLYINTGTITSPDFSTSNLIDTLGGIHIFRAGYNSHITPFLANIDSTTYLFAGSSFGDLVIYDSIENNLAGTFNPVDTIHFSSGYISPSLANINDNSSLELMIGETTGGIRIYGNGEYELALDTSASIVDSSIIKSTLEYSLKDKIKVFPNPAYDEINLQFQNIAKEKVDLSVYDLMGRDVYQRQYTPADQIDVLSIPILQLEKGIYVIKIEQGRNRSIHKFIKL